MIRDYEQGMSVPKPGNAVFYFAGKKRSEEVPLEGISIKDKIDEWTKIDPEEEGYGGRILVETFQDRKYQLLATTTYPGVGPHNHHMVRQTLYITL